MFSDDERKAFSHPTGAGERFADPLRVERRLQQLLGGELYETWALAVQRDQGRLEESLDAEERLLGAAREAFGMVAFDPQTGGGATDADCWQALGAFQEFMEKNARRRGASPASSPATASGPSPAQSPTPSTADCSGTPAGPS